MHSSATHLTRHSNRRRIIEPFTAFQPWRKRTNILGRLLLSHEIAPSSSFPYLDAAVFPAEDHLSQYIRGLHKEGMKVGENGALRISFPKDGLGQEKPFIEALREESAKRGIVIEEEKASDEAWPSGRLVIGRIGTHPALAAHFRHTLFGHPDETFPGKGEAYYSFRTDPQDHRLRGPLVASDESTAHTFACWLLKQLITDKKGDFFLPLRHSVIKSTDDPKRMTWRDLCQSWLERARHPLPKDAHSQWTTPESAAAFFSTTLRAGSAEENFYNGFYFAWLCEASRLYARDGDCETLRLFKAGLYEVAQYFLDETIEPGAPSDFDFYVGSLVHEYARWEELPLFTHDERCFFRGVLLGLARMIYRYYTAYYHGTRTPPRRPGQPRHNHQTFPARELYLAANYFSKFDIPDTVAWMDVARRVFDPRAFRRIKLCENANIYEWFAWEHAAAFSLMEYSDLRLLERPLLEQVAQRQVMTLDPSLSPVDYGDASPIPYPYVGGLSLTRMLVAAGEESVPLDLLGWADAFVTEMVEPPIFSILGGRLGKRGSAMKAPFGWTIAPLETAIVREFAPGDAPSLYFDKATFRSSWESEALYCCVEGFGNASFPHAHHSLLAIERLNMKGHVWLVSNGYGKIPNEWNALKAYDQRELGPKEHNVLVLDQGETLPPMLAQLIPSENQQTFSAMTCYGDTQWQRTISVISETEIQVTDRISNLRSTTAWLEWNLLGDLESLNEGRWLSKQGKTILSLTIEGQWATVERIPLSDKEWHSALMKEESAIWRGIPSCLRIHLNPIEKEQTLTFRFQVRTHDS